MIINWPFVALVLLIAFVIACGFMVWGLVTNRPNLGTWGAIGVMLGTVGTLAAYAIL